MSTPASHRTGTDPATRLLAWTGFLSLIAYAVILRLSFQFRYGEEHRDRPILQVLVASLVAFIAYLVVVRRLLCRPQGDGRGDPGCS